MIRVKAGAELTYRNLIDWYDQFKKIRDGRKLLHQYYENKDDSGSNILKLPFAKKLVITSSTATYGDGVVLTGNDKWSEGQAALFNKITDLWDKQQHDKTVKKRIKNGCISGGAYVLNYMSDDEEPVPKTTIYPDTNAFVVFDNTADMNSLFGVTLDEYKVDGTKYVDFTVYDNDFKYTITAKESDIDAFKKRGDLVVNFDETVPHYMGRMPLTRYWNNEEEQGDFEQIIDLMHDRTRLHDLSQIDAEKIVQNYLVANGIKIGNTEEEKSANVTKINKTPIIDVPAPQNPLSPVNPSPFYMVSKNANYSMIDIFGRDQDSKIYDLTLIPNLADDQFAGNQSGIALELKLMVFKALTEDKDGQIIASLQRELKIYIHALTQPIILEDGKILANSEYEVFDINDIDIKINRTWFKNVVELSQMISQLAVTGLFSDKTLVNMMPHIDYDEEVEQRKIEQKDKADIPDPNNSMLESYNALFRNSNNGAVDEQAE